MIIASSYEAGGHRCCLTGDRKQQSAQRDEGGSLRVASLAGARQLDLAGGAVKAPPPRHIKRWGRPYGG